MREDSSAASCDIVYSEEQAVSLGCEGRRDWSED